MVMAVDCAADGACVEHDDGVADQSVARQGRDHIVWDLLGLRLVDEQLHHGRVAVVAGE